MNQRLSTLKNLMVNTKDVKVEGPSLITGRL